MRKGEIFVGFEKKTGNEVFIRPAHMVVTGITAESGKTTTLQALIHRGKFKAIIFKTKIGERGITEGTIIPPFYKDDFDWEYASEIMEASRKEKLKFERSWIIKYAKTACNLVEFKANIDEALDGKLRELERSVLITLQAYLEKILPELQYAPLSNTLNPHNGINIMDLERFKEETQGLIIRSVLSEVLKHHKNTVCVIPECLKGNSLILMGDGTVKKIKEIKNGEKVFGGKVSHRFTKQASRLLRFSGAFDLETTLTHPCFVLEKGTFQKRKYRKIGSKIDKKDIKLKLAKDVRAGDYFLVPSTKIPHTVKYTWTPDQLGFVAMVLTDGNVRRGKNWGMVRVSVSKDVRWFREQFKKGLSAFGFEDTFREKKRLKFSSRKETVFYTNSKELCDLLWSFGCYGGKKSTKIDIVSQIFLSPLESIAKFINIAFCCDGNVSIGGFPRFGSTSEMFVKKLQFLLLKFGINSNMRVQDGSRYSTGKFWELVIFRESVKKFKELISFDMGRKQNKIAKHVSRKEKYAILGGVKYHFRVIKKIEKIKTTNTVYDFTTETHWFVANNILTHNCWKFLPEKFGSPVKRPAEAFIRQGATNNNYLYLDSQDITGVSKTILKQASNWFLGYQREINEIKRTLDQIPLPKRKKPTPDEIASLQVGHFIVATSQFVKTVYVQPIWLDKRTAKLIALGKMDVEDLEQPTSLSPFSIQTPEPKIPTSDEKPVVDLKPLRNEITELRNDFFNKLQQQQEAISKVYSDLYTMKTQKPEQEAINIDDVVGKVLQKMPMGGGLDKETLMGEILAKIPKVAGATTYTVAPLEKIRRDFLEEAKNKILKDIEAQTDNAKRLLKYLEVKGQGVKTLELEEKCFLMKHSGSATKKVSESSLALRAIEVAKKDTAGWHKGVLKQKITDMLGNHKATDDEIQQVYDHVMMEILGAGSSE